MEQRNNITQLLDTMVYPAFCAKDGVITMINQEAERAMVRIGDPVKSLMVTGHTEYAELGDGCLNLTLKLAGKLCCASVMRIDDFDAFVVDQDPEQTQLQAMALAAQQLRMPLSNIMAVADNLFPMKELSADPAANELAARVNRGLFQMLRIIGNMSDAYRYSTDTVPQMEYRDICSIWDEIWEQNAHLVSHAGLTLHYTGLRESIICLVDSEKLERAASNMLSNAIKFTPKGGIIDVRLTRRGAMLYLSVQNTGDTIPDSLRSSVYSRFLRQPGVEDSRHGIGLGMVLIRSTASCHGGTVLMEHSNTIGTRITMTMAIRQKSDLPIRTPAQRVDYAGELDHKLIELSECLPTELYKKDSVH